MSFEGFKLLTQIPELVAARLRSRSFFTDVPIIAEDVGEDYATLIEDRIDAKLGEIGLVAVVVPVRATAANENVPAVYYEKIPVVIRWIENPVVNRSPAGRKLLAPWCVTATNHYLNNYQLPGLAQIFVDDPPWARVPDAERIIYDCNHWTHGGTEET